MGTFGLLFWASQIALQVKQCLFVLHVCGCEGHQALLAALRRELHANWDPIHVNVSYDFELWLVEAGLGLLNIYPALVSHSPFF